MNALKSLFLLDPEVHFLNHGSFGACPIPVFNAYQNWQRRLERQPVLFLGREYDSLLHEARLALGAYLNAQVDDLVYIPNATHGVNIVARSLNLAPGDEVLTTDHEYGACDLAWEFMCSKSGAKYIHQPIRLPVQTEEEVVAQFWAGVTERTRVIYLSHITSPTALRLPVQRICALARRAGILTVIDAAHSPGQIPVDLQALGADIVFGNLHKWMLAPKGAAFLYARPEIQSRLEPLVVSWGYGKSRTGESGSRFVDYFQWTGTHDPSAALSVPAAIRFMQEQDWETVRRTCHNLLIQAVTQVCNLTQMPPLYPLNETFCSQMAIAPLPLQTDLAMLKARLYDEYKVEVPLIAWNDHKFVRISVQGYNSYEDIEALIRGLQQLLAIH
ncbi:MAG: aminotransferase [Anaerolineae bacterium]|nr:MAG: aminotransferase [Anaerolineae bacterium]